MGLGLAGFWRPFGISGGGGWLNPPHPPRYATDYNITAFSRQSNILRLDEKLVCSQSSVLLSLLS